jgi:hypothetical protein
VGHCNARKKRNYQEEFKKYEFTLTVINGKEGMQCVMYCEVLADHNVNIKG